MSTCIFCGHEGSLSREHVFPRWMSKVFADEHFDGIVRAASLRSGRREHWRPTRGFDVVVKAVCVNCNTGWMHELEETAKPILIPLMQGKSRTVDVAGQVALATWATKTILTLQDAQLGERWAIWPDASRWFERHRQPLPNSLLWVGRYEATKADQWPISVHQHGLTLQAPLGSPLPSRTGFNIVMALGHLVFWIFGADLDGDPVVIGSDGPRQTLIWPVPPTAIHWPPPEALRSESELERLSRRVPGGEVPRLFPPND